MLRNIIGLAERLKCQPNFTQLRWESDIGKTNMSQKVPVSNLEKRFMVWNGKYKSISEVPDKVSVDTLNKAKSTARIRISNIMMAATLLACIAMVISGKRAAKRGETVSQMNLEWHEQEKREYEKTLQKKNA